MSGLSRDDVAFAEVALLLLNFCFFAAKPGLPSLSARNRLFWPVDDFGVLFRCCGGVPAGGSFSFPLSVGFCGSSASVFVPCRVSTMVHVGLVPAGSSGKRYRVYALRYRESRCCSQERVWTLMTSMLRRKPAATRPMMRLWNDTLDNDFQITVVLSFVSRGRNR